MKEKEKKSELSTRITKPFSLPSTNIDVNALVVLIRKDENFTKSRFITAVSKHDNMCRIDSSGNIPKRFSESNLQTPSSVFNYKVRSKNCSNKYHDGQKALGF